VIPSLLGAWFAKVARERTIVVVGDSVPGDNDNGTEPHWPGRLRRLLAPACGHGGDGFFGLWRPEWDGMGGWRRAVRGDPWDRAPWGQTFTASGAQHVARFSRNAAAVTGRVTSFDLYYVDAPGAAPFAYRVDRGPWADVEIAGAGDDRLRRVTVAEPVASTVEVRAADARGSSARTYFVGIGLRDDAGGLVVHNLGCGGRKLSQYLARDHTSFVDLVGPDLVVLNISNDALDADTGAARAWTANLERFWAGVRAAKLLVTVAEQGYGRDVGAQAAWRATQLRVTAALGGATLDLQDHWGDYQAADAAGYWADIGVHPSARGYDDIAARVADLLSRPS
jgi:hypothetical protein